MTTYTWIYSFSETLSPSVSTSLSNDISHFLLNWKSHGADVTGEALLKYDRFLIVQSKPNESRPSGCSIDSMKKAVEQILQNHSIAYEDASKVFFMDGNNQIQFVHFHDIADKISSGEITESTVIFDHTLSQTDDLNVWEVPLHKTWLSRFLPTKKATP